MAQSQGPPPSAVGMAATLDAASRGVARAGATGECRVERSSNQMQSERAIPFPPFVALKDHEPRESKSGKKKKSVREINIMEQEATRLAAAPPPDVQSPHIDKG